MVARQTLFVGEDIDCDFCQYLSIERKKTQNRPLQASGRAGYQRQESNLDAGYFYESLRRNFADWLEICDFRWDCFGLSYASF